MLDLAKLVPQMRDLAARQSALNEQLAAMADEAVLRLRDIGPDWQAAAQKLDHSLTSWLVASFHGPHDAVFPPPPRPASYTALSTDGSQIASDRHEVALCYVINVGSVALRYCDSSSADLRSEPTLILAEDENDTGSLSDAGPVSPGRLANERASAEHRALSRLVEQRSGDADPAVAFEDGTLILWALEKEEEAFRRRAVREFEEFLGTSRAAGVPVMGYVSDPGSRDVVNAMRVLNCPFAVAHCDAHCREHAGTKRRAAPCAGIEDATDALMFRRVLDQGERSAVFGSRSKVLDTYGEENQIRFFYLHTGAEIARVEVPAWVAHNEELLELVHATALDQVAKGEGYPRVLTEAHELAVIRGPERAAFFELLESLFIREHVPVVVTRKAISKRVRSV